MKQLLISLLFLIILTSFCACSEGQVNTNLSPDEFSKMLKQDTLSTLLDVRTPEEYSKGHLENAKNINWKEDSFNDKIQTLDHIQPVYVYCLSGGRSAAAAESMRANGFQKVYELKGGISQWRNAGLPEVTEKAAQNMGMSREFFEHLLKTDKLVLINFYATWCTPCKQMEPQLLSLEKKWEDKLIVQRIDADENQGLFKILKINAIPTVLLYQNKKLIWSHEGYISKEEIEKQLK